MKYTFYGQSCFELETEGKKFLFDPFIQGNPLASQIDVSSLKPDYLFASHAHGDHIGDLVQIAKQSNAQVFAMVELSGYLSKKGVENLVELNFGVQNCDFGKLRTVWAVHSSSTPEGDYAGNPAGFVLQLEGKTIYFAGDTALTLEMKLLAELHTIDYAILPIGGHYTMDVDDAIMAAKFLKCTKIIGVHYNTFPPITIDTQDAVQKFEREGVQLLLPNVGTSLEL